MDTLKIDFSNGLAGFSLCVGKLFSPLSLSLSLSLSTTTSSITFRSINKRLTRRAAALILLSTFGENDLIDFFFFSLFQNAGAATTPVRNNRRK